MGAGTAELSALSFHVCLLVVFTSIGATELRIFWASMRLARGQQRSFGALPDCAGQWAVGIFVFVCLCACVRARAF